MKYTDFSTSQLRFINVDKIVAMTCEQSENPKFSFYIKFVLQGGEIRSTYFADKDAMIDYILNLEEVHGIKLALITDRL